MNKHIELAISNGAMTEPLNFVIFTEENNNVKSTSHDSDRREKQEECE